MIQRIQKFTIRVWLFTIIFSGIFFTIKFTYENIKYDHYDWIFLFLLIPGLFIISIPSWVLFALIVELIKEIKMCLFLRRIIFFVIAIFIINAQISLFDLGMRDDFTIFNTDRIIGRVVFSSCASLAIFLFKPIVKDL